MSDRPNRRRKRGETTPGSPTRADPTQASPPAPPPPASSSTPKKKKRERKSVDATCIVPNAVLSGLREAAAGGVEADDDAADPPSSRSNPSHSGVATKQQGVAAIRELYAKGDIDGALALATELNERSAEQAPITPRMVPDTSTTDASVWIGPAVDVSLPGLDLTVRGVAGAGVVGGADAPDASINVEVMGFADVSLTGIEPFAKPQPHHHPRGQTGPPLPAPAPAPAAAEQPAESERSLSGLTNIIDDIESLEPTIERRQRPSQELLLAQQRMLARELDPSIAPLVTMPSSNVIMRTPSEAMILQTLQTTEPSSAVGREKVLPPPPAVVMNLTLTERQSIPRVVAESGDIANLPLGPRGGFILSQIDGSQTLEEILDICAMSPSEAVEIIRHLQSLGVIVLD